jgi:hypothetical protein
MFLIKKWDKKSGAEQTHTTFRIFQKDIVMAVGEAVSGRVTPHLTAQQVHRTLASRRLSATRFKRRK